MIDRSNRTTVILGSLLALLLLYGLYERVLAPPFRNVQKQLHEAQVELQDEQVKLTDKRNYLGEYEALVQSVILQLDESMSSKPWPEMIRDYYHGKISDVFYQPRFQKSITNGEIAIGPAPTENNKPLRKRTSLDIIKYTISGTGDFASVVDLLLELYRLEDPLFVTKIDLNPQPKRGADKISDHLKFEIDLETVLIPKDEPTLLAAQEVLGPPTTQTVQTNQKNEHGRLALSPGEYDALKSWKPFDPYTKPPVVVKPPVTKPEQQPVRDVRKPEPPAKKSTGDPERDQWVIRDASKVAIGDVIVEEVMVVKEEAGRGSRKPGPDRQEARYFRVGEEFDLGTLIMVHRLGVVVYKKDSKEYWLYRRGAPMSAAIPLKQAVQEGYEYRELVMALKQRVGEKDAS